MNQKEELRPIAAVIIGNPNVGKSAIFNVITGSSQTIGNWCGKTTEACSVEVEYSGRRITFTDLPGVYGLGRHSREENAVNDFLSDNTPDVVVVAADASTLERNLYLVLQARERFCRVLLVFTKLDLAVEEGEKVDYEGLTKALGVSAVQMAAAEELDAADFFAQVLALADGPEPPEYQMQYPEPLERKIQLAIDAGALTRSDAILAVETLDENTQADFISARYSAAHQLSRQFSQKAGNRGETISDKIDAWALHRWLGVPFLAAIFSLLFYSTFAVSKPMSDLIGEGFDALSDLTHQMLPVLHVPDVITSLLADGILKGIGATMGFLPQMVVFFLIYALIQDSGYIVRVAFLMDRVMTSMGLNGKIFVPLVAGYSCNVNGIIASRMLTSKFDRTVAIMASSYAPCSARIGVMVFLVSAFFPSSQATVVMLSLLLIGVLLMAVVSLCVRWLIPRDEASAFIMEVPPYVIPSLQDLLQTTARRTLRFLSRIKNVIIYSSVVMWFLSSYPAGPFEGTYIARLGQMLEPFGAVMGLNWQLIVALLLGIAAKETALTALGIMYHAANVEGGLAVVLAANITPISAFTFLLVYMIYTPCLTTIVTMYQETGSWRLSAVSVLMNLVFALGLGIISYNLGKLLF